MAREWWARGVHPTGWTACKEVAIPFRDFRPYSHSEWRENYPVLAPLRALRFSHGWITGVSLCLSLAVWTPAISASNRYECQPVKMTDADAGKIVETATAHGSRFRSEIDNARENGISMKSDTTLAELLANKEEAEKFASINAERDIAPAGGPSIYTISPSRANYFSLALDKHLLLMAGLIGQVTPDFPYSFRIDAEVFDFALFHFSKAAEFSYLGRERWIRATGEVRTIHRFQETFWPFRADKLWFVEIILKYSPEARVLTVAKVLFLGRDPKSLLALPPSTKFGDCPRTIP